MKTKRIPIQPIDGSLVGKVVLLDDGFKGSESERLFLCSGGFGCEPDAGGSAVFGNFLADGEKTRVERSDILGIVDKADIPAKPDRTVRFVKGRIELSALSDDGGHDSEALIAKGFGGLLRQPTEEKAVSRRRKISMDILGNLSRCVILTSSELVTPEEWRVKL